MTPHQDVDRLEDWAAETHESIAARLEGAKTSQAQLRLTLATIAVISGMMLIASYNAYLSYDYNWLLKVKCDQAAPVGGYGILQEQAFKDWASARIVLISLLGIRVSVDDVAVLGSAVLFILSFWLLLVARRENYNIGFLLRDTNTQRPDSNQDSFATQPMGSQRKIYSGAERWLIFHTIISTSLFFTLGRLAKVESLAGPNSLAASSAGDNKGWLNRVGLELIRSFFFWFPVIASLTVFVIDRLSYLILRDPFDPTCAVPGIKDPFFLKSLVFFLVCWIPLWICCQKSSQYSRATEKVLREYRDTLHADLLKEQQQQSGKN